MRSRKIPGMAEYEIYSYEQFRKNIHDEQEILAAPDKDFLDQTEVQDYLVKLKKNRPNLSKIDDHQILSTQKLISDHSVSLAALMLFGLDPQAVFPQLCILASVIPGTEMGVTDPEGKRFLDSRRIEGTLPQMLTESMKFVRRNLRYETSFDSLTGERKNDLEIPASVIREALLNSLIHRDYSRFSRNKAIYLEIYTDRIELRNPGCLYGLMTMEKLGYENIEPRNPLIVRTMEYMEQTENRQSGIPAMRRQMLEHNLPLPEFINNRDSFAVILHRRTQTVQNPADISTSENSVLIFCRIPRTRKEITAFLHRKSTTDTMKRFVLPLVEEGRIILCNPGGYSARNQRFATSHEILKKLGLDQDLQ